MSGRDLDGNLHFLNKYLDEQEDYTGEEAVYEDITGELLFDEIGDVGLERAYKDLVRCVNKYPEGQFEEGVARAEYYLKEKAGNKLTVYIQGLAIKFYGQIKYWFDPKWLVLEHYDEVENITNVLEVISDLVYQSDHPFMPEEYVDLITVGYELEEVLGNVTEKHKNTVNEILFGARIRVAVVGLHEAGITRDVVFTSTPEQLLPYIIDNSKKFNSRSTSLQVNDRQQEEIFNTLGLSGGKLDQLTEDEINSIYVNTRSVYNKRTTSKRFKEVVKLFKREIDKRHPKDKTFRYRMVVYNYEGLVLISTSDFHVAIDQNVSVYQRKDINTKGIVVRKSIHKIRVKDIKEIVGYI